MACVYLFGAYYFSYGLVKQIPLLGLLRFHKNRESIKWYARIQNYCCSAKILIIINNSISSSNIRIINITFHQLEKWWQDTMTRLWEKEIITDHGVCSILILLFIFYITLNTTSVICNSTYTCTVNNATSSDNIVQKRCKNILD